MKARLYSIMILLLCSGLQAEAQTWDEWFQQKKTQRKYLLKQIAMLKVHLNAVKKGVTVVRRGLNTVENVKNGEFNLHRDFFRYLDQVNPVIANSAKVADIVAYQVFILRQLNAVHQYCAKNKQFTAEEVRYVANVYANMLVLCDANLAELLAVIRPAVTRMTDDERMERIDALHDDMKDKQQFARSFERDIRFIGHVREKEQAEVSYLQGLFD